MPESEKTVGLDNLTILVTTKEWKEYVKILKDRQIYLQKEVNRFIRTQNLIEAYGMLCKLDDIDKTLQIVVQRLETLRKEK